MHRKPSKQYPWQGLTLFAIVLLGATVSIAVSASGCGPNDVFIHNCPDAGQQDGGDAGDDAGPVDPVCNQTQQGV